MSYRLGAGTYDHEHDGVVVHTDRRHVDPKMLAVVVTAMRRTGLEPDDVHSATIVFDECDLALGVPDVVPFVEFEIVLRRPHIDGIGTEVSYGRLRVPVESWVRDRP